jgi:carboxyl-terminal processing protease
MKRMFLFWSALGLLAHSHAARLEPEGNQTQVAKATVATLPRVHMSHEPLSESLTRRTLDNYLRTLDFDRTIFLASDVEAFRLRLPQLQRELENGDLSFAFDAFTLFKERASNRVDFVRSLLDKGFDVAADEEFVWKRKDAAWPADQAEWDDLWAKKVKNEYVGRLVSTEMRRLEAEEKAAKTNEVSEASPGTNAVVEATAAKPEDPEDKLSPEQLIRKRYDQFRTVLDSHDSEYVLQMYLNSFTRAFDTHSSYFSPRNEEDFDIQMRLSLTGIGALLTSEEGAAKIEKLIKGGPAERDGRLQPGDKIIAVAQDQEPAVDILFWPLYKSVRLIRGPIGSTVVLHVIPASDPTGTEVKLINLVRDEIKLEEKAAKSQLHELPRGDKSIQLGIIHLPDFYADLSGKRENNEESRSSATDVLRLLRELNAKSAQGLILDLRNNGGGSLPDAVEMTGFFIDQGPVVQVKAERQVRPLYDPERGLEFDKPMVVLVNRQSASASEILAAALQDYGRAIIVGDSKTHGKGSVQSLMPLDREDESLGALKVTTAAFYRVDGRSTQLKGVSPDVEIRTPTDVMELGEEYLDNVLPWTWIRPTRYQPSGDLRALVKQIQMQSQARLAENKEFKYYQDKIDRLAERVQRRKISLRLEERLAQAKADRELDKLQQSGLMLGDEEEDDAAEDEVAEIRPDKDLILKEGLEILADLIELSQPRAAAIRP